MIDPSSAVVQVAIVAAWGAFAASLVSAVAAIVAAHIGHKNNDAVHEIHVLVDGQLSEYRELMAKLVVAAHDTGAIEERDNQRAVEKRANAAKLDP